MTTLFKRSSPDVKQPVSSGPDNAALQGIADVCARAARGDLEARITGIPEDPEIARICREINHLLDITDAFVREAAAAMEACAQDRFHRPILLRGLKGAFRHSAQIINRAGVKMRGTAEQLADTGRLAGETASNVTMIAAACEELNTTSNEISRQASQSATLARSAVTQGSEAHLAVKSLGDATRNIDSVLALIHKIADQTNLLALNATIEAARAGVHGRGFAVVANEVKDLSRNSVKATHEIARQVEGMQKSVRDVTGFIGAINNSLQDMDAASGAIAKSVQEQVQATGDISRNLGEASANTSRISERIRAKEAANQEPVFSR